MHWSLFSSLFLMSMHPNSTATPANSVTLANLSAIPPNERREPIVSHNMSFVLSASHSTAALMYATSWLESGIWCLSNSVCLQFETLWYLPPCLLAIWARKTTATSYAGCRVWAGLILGLRKITVCQFVQLVFEEIHNCRIFIALAVKYDMTFALAIDRGFVIWLA